MVDNVTKCIKTNHTSDKQTNKPANKQTNLKLHNTIKDEDRYYRCKQSIQIWQVVFI